VADVRVVPHRVHDDPGVLDQPPLRVRLRAPLLSSCWTALCLVVAAVSVYPALVMWTVMFTVFAVPTSFAQFTGQRILGHDLGGSI
jgi:fatty acid desaturase